MIFAILILALCAFSFTAGYLFRKKDYEAGRSHGYCEERSRCNARVIEAKMLAFRGGVRFGMDKHKRLMHRWDIPPTPSNTTDGVAFVTNL